MPTDHPARLTLLYPLAEGQQFFAAALTGLDTKYTVGLCANKDITLGMWKRRKLIN